MSQGVKKHANVLKWLSEGKPSDCRIIIKGADKDLVDTLCECGLNVLMGRVPLTPTQKDRLRRYKNVLRKLTHKKTPIREKKALLQTGGFLGALLGPVLGVLGNLLFH